MQDLTYFQYTSDFPAASALKVTGKEPNPPNRPIFVSKVTVTVISSFNWILPVFDHLTVGVIPVSSRSKNYLFEVSDPTLPTISASLTSSVAKVSTCCFMI